jgi:Flp pilus assembly protein TadG
MLRRKLYGESGSAFVELALVMPLFTFLIVGAAEFGRLAYASIEVSNAARAGVAYGAQNHADASNISEMEATALLDASNIGTMAANAGPCICPASSATASVPACNTTFFTGSSTATPPTPSANSFSCPSTDTTTTEYVQVDTKATVSTLFTYPGLPNTYTLTGTATMAVEQ